jgi:hypothetical protein
MAGRWLRPFMPGAKDNTPHLQIGMNKLRRPLLKLA